MKEFKTESKKIMNLMINSIYTNKEIFLRELISNASDATDKVYYETLKTNDSTGFNRNDYPITIEINKENRTLSISDNGIGMNQESLENNLGTIAKSGSEEFSKMLENKDDISLIGQFGVGFYSAFMVCDRIEVFSKARNETKAYKWESQSAEGYEITETQKDNYGTTIVLYLKPNNDDYDYDQFLEEYKIKSLIKKYSDYIRYPIQIKVEKNKDDEKIASYETINTQTPIWRKNKNELTIEEYNTFYKDMFKSVDDPLKVIHFQVEGKVTFKALLYIPKTIPYGYYSKEYEKGVKLYTNGVMITEKCSDLLPDYLNFVKGVVDGELNLNISRETLQQSRELVAIKNHIEDKITSTLIKMQQDENDTYIEFFKAFGLQIKYSIYKEWGMNKDKLEDLLMYYSVKNEKFTTLGDYFSKMPSDQKYIYYTCGSTIDGSKSLPQTERLIEKGYDVLCMNEEIDEFVIRFLREYHDKEFKNIMSDDLGIYNDEDESQTEEKKEIGEYVNNLMKDIIDKIKFTSDLKNHPVCLSSEGDISLEMERMLNQNSNSHEKIVAKKILQINTSHSIFEKIEALYKNKDDETLKDLLEVLFNQAKLISGLPIDNPSDYVSKVTKLLS